MARLVAFALLVLAGYCYAGERIVGGVPATIERYPSVVQVDSLNSLNVWGQSCAANILNNLYVLSAAHCFAGSIYDPTRRRIRAGATYRNTGGIIIPIVKEFNHPDYGTNGNEADLSVVRLASPLIGSSTIQGGSFPGPGNIMPDDQPCAHVGWGTTEQGGSPSDQLQWVMVYSVNNDLCRERYESLPNPGIVTPNMICAGLLDEGGADACQGDSGGPLFAFGSITMGIVSWGHGCGNATFPGVSIAVSPYIEWVIEVASQA